MTMSLTPNSLQEIVSSDTRGGPVALAPQPCFTGRTRRQGSGAPRSLFALACQPASPAAQGGRGRGAPRSLPHKAAGVVEGTHMSRWRIVVVLVLVAVPFLVLAGAGSYWLWESRLGLLVWWPMNGPGGAGLRARHLLAAQAAAAATRRHDPAGPRHGARQTGLATDRSPRQGRGTPRQRQTLRPAALPYLAVAQEMGRELAVHYYPNTED